MDRVGYRARRLRDVAAALGRARELKQRERWPRERLERFQQARLEALVRYAAERSPFWRERLPAGRVRLDRLPTLDKATMMDRFDELVSDRRLRRDALLEHIDGLDRDELYLGEYRVMATSGSSGRRGLFAYDRAGWVELLAQFLRYTDWAGSRPRLPRLRLAAIGGASPTHMTQRLAASFDIGLHRLLNLPVTLPVPRLVDELNAFGPDFVNAYPSIAAPLAEEQLAGRLRLRLRGMSTSSEPLTPELRERLERAFGVRPVNLYGTTEGLWGCDCETGAGLHLFEDMCLVENVDAAGNRVPDGEPGERLLVTNLFNLAQPLIRFELTDTAAVEPEPCPCGRTLLRLRSMRGRSEDVIELAGVLIHPLQFGFLTADPDVREFQIVQEGERLRLRVALAPEANGAVPRLRAALARRLREAGVKRPAIDVEVVERLERTAGGKLPLIVADRGNTATASGEPARRR
jgi:phenylacetate-CoA ligase